MLEKLAEELWKRNINVSLSEMRKWVWEDFENPENVAEHLKAIHERVGKPWTVTVVLNQTLYMFESPQEREEFLSRMAQAETDPVSAVIAWRKEKIGPYVALHAKTEPPKYVESTEDVNDFFRNTLRYDGGIDLEEIDARVKEVVEDRYLPDFFRLVDIDAPISPDEFVRRVDKAVDVLATAKEQGLDVARIMRRWDALADRGGERLTKLPAAVKAVAEEAVKERFWKEVAKILEENGVRVFFDDVPDNTVGSFYYLSLAEISGGDVDLTDATQFLSNLATVLRKARAIPMYRITEVGKFLKEINLDKIKNRDVASAIMDILASIDRRAAKMLIDGSITSAVAAEIERAVSEGIDADRVVEAVNEALVAAYMGEIAGEEEVVQYIEKRLFS